MKVIEKAKPKWSQRIKCKGCEAVLEIETEDLKYEVTEAMAVAQQYAEEIKGQYYVNCPECGMQLIVKNIPPLIEKQVQERY